MHSKGEMMGQFTAVTAWKSFEGGFVATLVFHQGLLALLHLAAAAPAPYNFSPVPPLGVPAVLSLAFWGGLWGLPVAWLILSQRGAAYWWRAIAFGAIGPSSVALFIVFPLKGLPLAGGWDPKLIIGALLLNGAWGLGLGLWLRLRRAAGG